MQIKRLEATLVGALRREKLSETEARRLDAEVAHMKRLVFLVWLIFSISFQQILVHNNFYVCNNLY